MTKGHNLGLAKLVQNTISKNEMGPGGPFLNAVLFY